MTHRNQSLTLNVSCFFIFSKGTFVNEFRFNQQSKTYQSPSTDLLLQKKPYLIPNKNHDMAASVSPHRR